MTLWQARDVYRVKAFFRALLILFFLLEFSMEATHGYWYIGVVLVAVQYAVLRCLGWLLRWGLLWVRRGLWWCIDHTKMAVVAWWQTCWRA
jgi:hypothetical protein